MELEELQKAWKELNERVSQNELVHQQQIIEMLSRQKESCLQRMLRMDKIASIFMLGVTILMFVDFIHLNGKLVFWPAIFGLLLYALTVNFAGVILLTKIKKENAGNDGKIKQLTDALNGQVVPKLKMHMTDQQIGTLVVALGLQENILSGKNISPDQKLFMDNIRNQYGLNDVQTMSVILVLVQGKIRGDAIGLMSKVNPQQAGQEFITLMQDLDGQLKSSLNNDQYVKVKSDIEKLIKGQKL